MKINFTCETIISYVELGHLTCEKGFHISNHMWNFRNQSIKYTLQSHLQDFCNQHLRMRWNYLSIFCPYDLRIPHSLSANLLVVLKDEHGPEMFNNLFPTVWLRCSAISVESYHFMYVYILSSKLQGGSVAQSSEQAPFTSEFVGSTLATDSREKSQSTLCRKSWISSGCSGFLAQGMLTGWVGISP